MEKEEIDTIEVRIVNGRKGLYASGSISRESIILSLEGVIKNSPSRYTIQTGPFQHLSPFSIGSPDRNGEWQYLNHSCNPNTRIEIEKLQLVALRDLSKGEELTFNYNSTEYKLAEPFQCNCGSEECVGLIQGYAFLDPRQKEKLSPLVSGFLPNI